MAELSLLPITRFRSIVRLQNPPGDTEASLGLPCSGFVHLHSQSMLAFEPYKPNFTKVCQRWSVLMLRRFRTDSGRKTVAQHLVAEKDAIDHRALHEDNNGNQWCKSLLCFSCGLMSERRAVVRGGCHIIHLICRAVCFIVSGQCR